jgi:hypothetical protein
MARQFLALTRLQALALRARLNTALGYPRTPTAADRVGGGTHTPLDEARTLHAVAIEDHPSDATRALVVLRNMPSNRLNAGERAALLDARPVEFVRDAPLADAKLEAPAEEKL